MIRLYVNIYEDSNHARDAELKKCIELNFEKALFDDITQLYGRPTYNDFFHVINETTGPNDINIIANSDIFFEELPLEWFKDLTFDKAYALTRWDYLNDGRKVFYNNSGSQDVWIFRGPVKPVEGADFTMGLPGCENKLAYLMTVAGYEVSNPSLTIKAYHLHNSGIRHYTTADRLPKPRINVQITAL